MGTVQTYPDIRAELAAWEKVIKAEITNINTQVSTHLSQATSAANINESLTGLEKLLSNISTMPKPAGAAANLPLSYADNCLLASYQLNLTYERMYTTLQMEWTAMKDNVNNAVKYLSALRSVQTAHDTAATAVADANLTTTDFSGSYTSMLLADTKEATSWVMLKDHLVTTVTQAGYDDPAKVNASQALLTLQLPNTPNTLYKYVDGLVTNYAKLRLAILGKAAADQTAADEAAARAAAEAAARDNPPIVT